jgi:hypothetical protein
MTFMSVYIECHLSRYWTYWNRGGGQQTMSFSVNNILSPILLPLLSTEQCVKHAAFLQTSIVSGILAKVVSKDLRHTRRARRKLDIDNIIRIQLLWHQPLTFSIPKHIHIATQRSKRCSIHSTTRVLNDDDTF